MRRMSEIKDIRRKPRRSARGIGFRVEGEDMAAEPVPVRLPGDDVMGVDVSEGAGSIGGLKTGSKKMGSKLLICPL